jgi:predicted phosphatase
MTYVAISDIAPAELDALAFVKGSLKRSENSGATLSVDLGPAWGAALRHERPFKAHDSFGYSKVIEPHGLKVQSDRVKLIAC